MALPLAFESEALQVAHEYFLTLELSDLQSLTREDAFLIGSFVQVFNFIELNLRRSLEVFRAAGLVDKKGHVSPAELVRLVKEAVGGMAIEHENIADSLAKLDEIEFRRPFQNLLAHWAAKRIPNHDAIALLSMDTKDSKQVFNQQVTTKDHCMYSILLVPDLRGLLLHVANLDEWLGRKTAEWHVCYPV